MSVFNIQGYFENGRVESDDHTEITCAINGSLRLFHSERMLSTTLYCTCILFVVVKRSDSFSSVHGIGKCRIQRVDFIRHRPRESRVRPLLLPTFHPVLGAAGVRNEDIEVQDNSTFDGTASLQEESGRSPVEEEVTLIASSKANALAADSVPARTTTQSDPSYRSLILFTATTVLIWLSEPLLR